MSNVDSFLAQRHRRRPKLCNGSVILMLGRRRRRRANNKTTLAERLVVCWERNGGLLIIWWPFLDLYLLGTLLQANTGYFEPMLFQCWASVVNSKTTLVQSLVFAGISDSLEPWVYSSIPGLEMQ